MHTASTQPHAAAATQPTVAQQGGRWRVRVLWLGEAGKQQSDKHTSACACLQSSFLSARRCCSSSMVQRPAIIMPVQRHVCMHACVRVCAQVTAPTCACTPSGGRGSSSSAERPGSSSPPASPGCSNRNTGSHVSGAAAMSCSNDRHLANRAGFKRTSRGAWGSGRRGSSSSTGSSGSGCSSAGRLYQRVSADQANHSCWGLNGHAKS